MYLHSFPDSNIIMGFFMSKSMDANLKRQQEFMLHNSRLQVSECETAFAPVECLLEQKNATVHHWKCYFIMNSGTTFEILPIFEIHL